MAQANNGSTAIIAGTLLGTNNAVQANNPFNPVTTNILGSGATDFATATVASTTAGSTVGLFGAANLAGVHFLPTNSVLTAAPVAPALATGVFNPFNATVSNYSNAGAWTGTPKLVGNASAFTLTNLADNGKNVVISEVVTGTPFTTGNGAVAEALSFTGTDSDRLVIKHNISVVNTPAATNASGVSVDVRNESNAESYANGKSGVASNYADASSHKFTEANGNLALNDVFVQNYSYKDTGLSIASAVKTVLADAKLSNGAENVAENNAANYHYAGAAGTVDYVVTDVRNLVRTNATTFTDTSISNVAQYKVVDKVSGTTIEAKGVVVGTTTNAAATAFKATNASFTVANNNYSLDVKDASSTTVNIFNTLLGLGNPANGGTLFNSPLGANAPLAANVYTNATGILTGTAFSDTITVKTTAAPAAQFAGNINARAGNDTITGNTGNDTIDGGAGADSIVGGLGVNSLTGGAGADTFNVTGTDTITDFVLGTDALTISKGTASAVVTISDANNAPVTITIPANATTDTTIAANTTVADFIAKFPATAVAKTPITLPGTDNADTLNGSFGNDSIDGGKGADVLTGGAGNDTLDGGSKGQDTLTGGTGADTFKFSEAGFIATTAPTRQDTVTDFKTADGDKIDLATIDANTTPAPTPALTGAALAAFNAAVNGDQAFSATILNGAATPFTAAGQLRFDATTNTLQGNTDADFATVEFSVVLTGVSAVIAADFVL